MSNLTECGSPVCFAQVEIENPATVTVPGGLSPHTQTYYHSVCYDPWADWAELTGYGASEDPVNSPSHYRWLPNGIEVIDITETLNFCMGNAIKYILRADHKGKPEEDIAKAIWYLQRELSRRSVTMATTRGEQ